MVTTKTWAQWTTEGSKSPIETDGYIIYRVTRTVCRTRSYTALAVPRNGLGSVDPRGGDWRAMRLPVIDCRAMMHGASVSSNKDVASQLPFSNRSVMSRRRAALLTCVLALCAAGSQAHARGERGGFGGFGGFFGGGHAMHAGAPDKKGGQGPARGRGGEERSRRAAAMENRRGENADRGAPQRKLSPEERRQLRQNIYDVTRDIYHRGG
ncbi:hypothetical protein LMG18091_04048 [Ralstonia wenshanensis]|uniref:Uncharacterized protein n=3 Tax=Burkholderiaceae TaxID=119060 RepID=A0AAD2B6K1_9RALS|nr:hypothetical protein LMG18091_04048 [Ralstonia wenshanensis]